MKVLISSLGRCGSNYLLDLFELNGYYAIQHHEKDDLDEDKFSNSSKSVLFNHIPTGVTIFPWVPETSIDKIIFLSRRDKLAHAFSFAVIDYLSKLNIEDDIVSVWHPSNLHKTKIPKTEVDPAKLLHEMKRIEYGNNRWKKWADQNKFEYSKLYYEDLFSIETADILRNDFDISSFPLPYLPDDQIKSSSKKNPIQAKDIFENYEDVVWSFKQGYIK